MKNNVSMKGYDIACIDNITRELSLRLGYKKILSKTEIVVVEKPLFNSKIRYILLSEDDNLIRKALRDKMCAGISFKENSVIKKSLEQLHEAEKPLFINGTILISAKKSELPRILHKTRNLLKNAIIHKTIVVIASFAKDNAHLLSSSQLNELALFIYDDEKIAKKMVLSLSDILLKSEKSDN